MKQLFTIILTSLIILSPLAAVDFGGYLDNNSSVVKAGNADVSFNQSNSIFLWASAPLGETMYIKGEGMYKYNLNLPSKLFTQYADLDLLKLAGTFNIAPGTINMSLGRFAFSDLTGTIFSQTTDGLYLNLSAQTIDLNLYAGFTGLLNSNTVSILDEDGVIHAPENEIYALNAFYIPIIASVSLPFIFLNQTLSIQASGFIDVSEEQYNRMYASIDLTGPLSSIIFYNFSTTIGTENFNNIMNLSKFSLSIFPIQNILINAGFLYASGEQSKISSFRGFSSHPAYNAAIDMQTTSCMIPSITANMTLLQDKMLLALTGKGIFTIWDKNIKDKSLDATGFQGDISAIYNIFPDFQVGLSGSMFKGFNDYSSLDKFSATLKFAITF